MRRRGVGLWLGALLGLGSWVPLCGCVRATCDVRALGWAVGDGQQDDSAGLRRAVRECGHVVLENGTFLSGTVELRSHVIFEIRRDATLVAARPDGTNFAAAEGGFYEPHDKGPWNQERFQDYGHSNLRDAFLLMDSCENVTLGGGGSIDGSSHVSHRDPRDVSHGDLSAYPTKLVSIKSSRHVRIGGVFGDGRLRLRRGGWITLLMNNASRVDVVGVRIEAVRDGMNVISSTHVLVDDVDVRGGSDDAIALKSDFALREILPAGPGWQRGALM